MVASSELRGLRARVHSRGRRLLLAAVVVLGAVLRLQGLTFGMPSFWHPDERPAAMAVHECVRGRSAERRYRHPPLFVKTACRLEMGARALLPAPPPRIVRELLAMRSVSAAAGTATIAFVYLVALRLMGVGAALGAAALLAVFPSAVMSSKYGAPDSLMTMLLVAALWLHLRLAERGRSIDLVAAAAVTTLAVAAKYNAAFLCFPFALAFAAAARSRGRSILSPGPLLVTAATILVVAGLAFSTAIAEGEIAKVFRGASAEGRHLASAGHFGFALGPAEGGLLFHFRHSILPASGPLLLVAVVAGLATMALRGGFAGWLTLAFAVPYYVVVELIFKVPPSFERYALPLVPVYVLAAALVAERLSSRLSGRAGAVVLAALLAIEVAVPLARTVQVLDVINDDTRARMRGWLKVNLEEGETVYAQWPSMTFYYPGTSGRSRLKAVDGLLKDRTPQTGVLFLASSLVYQRYLEFPDQEPRWTEFYRRLFAEGQLLHEESAGDGTYMFHNPVLRLYRFDPPPAEPKRKGRDHDRG